MKPPFEIVRVAGSHALEELRSLASQGRGYPVLLGTQENLDNVMENFAYVDDSVEELIEEAESLDPAEWLRERAEGDPEYYEEIHGEWPGEFVPSDSFSGHTNILTGEPYDEVVIALLPIEAAWQAPCALKTGGWNECPHAAEHASMFRLWEESYGAKVVTISGDTIEMSVARPPSTREEALALAHQQYIYCPDIVQQGTDSIEALAAVLQGGTAWFFWWD
jgi:hypothetical protein